MDVRDQLRSALRTGLFFLGVDPVPDEIPVERPRDPSHGDWSSPVALAVAKAAGRNPRELAQALVESISADPPPHVVAVELAGPGFVNFRLRETWLHEVLVDVVDGGVDGYATPDVGAGRSVNVEFVSANPTGPLHAGHGRWAAYGDSLARLMARCGYEVHREFYVNDRGAQVRRFGESLLARRDGLEPPEDGYVGDYVREWAAEMPAGVSDPDEVARWGIERAHRDQVEVLASMGVVFDTYAGRWSSAAPPRRRWPPCGCRATCSTPTAQCGCAPPSSATTRTGC